MRASLGGRRLTAGSLVVTIVVGGLAALGVATATSAAAAVPPVIQRPAGAATADSLPTVQMNGIVLTQGISGNTVWAGGEFTKARPAGSAPGVDETTRSNILAFDVRTGVMTSFAPNPNAKVKAIALSPDGTRVYVAGSFTSASGANRYRIAAYNTATGALITNFAPSVNATINSLAVTNTTVYAGGFFSSVSGNARGRLAAFSATNGALLGWAPTADGDVDSMTVTPDGSKLVVGGKFQNLNGSPAYGMGALDIATGTLLPWTANTQIRNGGAQASVYRLMTNGDTIYGTGWSFGSGNFEGTFALNNDGTIKWLTDCHGDAYDTTVSNGVVYQMAHAHMCSNVGSYPEVTPRRNQYALAFTADARGTVATNTQPGGHYVDWAGYATPSPINWFPSFEAGTYSGTSQAGWSLTSNSQYIVAGGEFVRVNNKLQQGLVRFAVPAVAPNKVGPTFAGADWVPSATINGTAVRFKWQANSDFDDQDLTYTVFREDKGATPIYTTVATAQFWNRQTLSYKDAGLTAGASYRYRVRATDPNGNVATSSWVSVTVPVGATASVYADKVLDDGATNFWRLGEAGGTTTADDWAGTSDLAKGAGISPTAGALAGDNDGAAVFDGSANGTAGTTTAVTGPDTFTIETWIKTTTTSGGKIVGFGNTTAPNNSGGYDRHLYMSNSGQLVFGVYPGGVRTVTSPKAYNDGAWHLVTASMSGNGMKLTVDGLAVASDAGVTSAQPYEGYWRVGGDNLGSWPSQPSSSTFNGSIDEVAIYPTELSLAKIRDHLTTGGGTVDIPVAPTDTYGKAVYNDNPSLYWRFDDTTGTAAKDVTPNKVDGLYTGGYTLGAPSPVTGPSGKGVAFDGSSGTVGSTASYDNPTTYSEELWFNTTTTNGGKLIGFGRANTGTSDGYDRHVYMESDGRLTFGTYTGQLNTATSPTGYNDGQWHYLVASQSSSGMQLWVDGQLVGTNPQTGAEGYTGYWRVGGDNVWNGLSPYFNGVIDEVAVYPYQLSAAQVGAHLAASPIAPNARPTASFTQSCTAGACSFDASASSDTDGSIASYAWDFGDGTTGSGVNATYSYTLSGSYPVTLTVTDDRGATGTAATNVTVTVPVANQAPTAVIGSTCTAATCTVDGSGSTDVDGTIASYAWNYGDGTTATGVTPASHTYAASGTYTVTLVVTDDDGSTGTATKSVTAAVPNAAPTAAFTSSAAGLTGSFNAGGSTDSDGTIASYAWQYGDGTTGTGVTSSHPYATAGTYQVTLVVTDNSGGTGTITKPITVTAAANQPPVAAFTVTSTGLTASFNGGGSTDDGTITGYAWTYGDGGTGTGATSSRTYTGTGTYTATLTVTDNGGLTASTTRTVTITTGTVAAADTFTRALTGRWNSADTGGAWTLSGATAFSTDGTTGKINLATAGSGPTALLNAVAQGNVNITVDTSISKVTTGSGAQVALMARKVGTTDYRLKLRYLATGKINLVLSRVVSGAETVIREVAVAGLTYAPGEVIRMRFQVTGSGTTTLTGKAWKAGTAEPTAAQVTATDTTAGLQGSGAVGLQGYLTGSATNAPAVVTVDSFLVTTA